MGVVRVKQNVLRESSVGRHRHGRRPGWPRAALARRPGPHVPDVALSRRQELPRRALGARDGSRGLRRRKRGVGREDRLPERPLGHRAHVQVAGRRLRPVVRLRPAAGVQIVNFSANFQPRPTRPILGLHVRQMFNEFENTLVTDLSGKWESYRVFMAPVNWRLESGDRFEFNVVPDGERLTAPFEIADGVVIAPGSYHWTRFRLEGGLASKRTLSAQLTWWFGGLLYRAPRRAVAHRQLEAVTALHRRAERHAQHRAAGRGRLHAGGRGHAIPREHLARPAGQQLPAVRQRQRQLRDEHATPVDVLAVRRAVRGLQPQHGARASWQGTFPAPPSTAAAGGSRPTSCW